MTNRSLVIMPFNAGPVLLLGGTGKVARSIAALLAKTDMPTIQASRSGATTEPDATNISGVAFDWHDETTYAKALAATPRAVFLVAPPILDSFSPMSAFINIAREKGVRRFVLLSSSALEADEEGVAMGKVHAYLKALDDEGRTEWAALRPTWFQENLVEHRAHVVSIWGEGKVYSATGEGRIPWVAVEDIAASAFQLLTQEAAPNAEFLVLGPELLSYGDIAAIISDVLGRKVVHHQQTPRERKDMFAIAGMPDGYADMMAALDVQILHGSEERTNDVVLKLTGREPRKFRVMAEQRKEVWLSDA
ncbi:Festuclavine synthase II like protein [Verticillium longisporum]|uniref:Festuclavine synthase II like protein n=1 Tax=Verticillium longisporum TaxID=100787 RepID=A0A8I2ZXB8_VERLO|nr:Festuclavine synthase II like protein [Verticillium longisporum]